MTDFQSRPPTPSKPRNSKLLGWAQAFISNASGMTKNFAGMATLVIFVTVSGFLTVEQAVLWFWPDHTKITAKRDFLCNKHAYTIAPAPQPATQTGDTTQNAPEEQIPSQAAQLRNIQDKMVEIYNLKELARQHAIPFDTIGRVQYFLRCGRVTDVTTSAITFTLTEGERKPYSQNLKALYDWEDAGFELVSAEFSSAVPPIILGTWRQRLDILKGALAEIETTVAPVATGAQLAATSKDTAKPPENKQLLLVKPDAEDIGAAWLLITASDINEAAAASEVQDLRQALSETYKASIGNVGSTTLEFSPRTDAELKDYVAMYETGGRIRTVVAFKDRESANIARQVLQQEGLIRLDAYTRNVAAWCSGKPTEIASATDGPPFYDCS